MIAPVYVWSDTEQRKVYLGVSIFDGRDGLLPDRGERRDTRLIEHALSHDKQRPTQRCACGKVVRGQQCEPCRRAAQRAAVVRGKTCPCGAFIGREAMRCKRCVGFDKADQLVKANRERWRRVREAKRA